MDDALEPDIATSLVDIVDYVLPVLTPYQLSLYIYLLRNSRVVGRSTIRIGKRSIAAGLGKGTRASRGNYAQISEKLAELAQLGFLKIGDTTREGTAYEVQQPQDVPLVREAMDLRSEAPGEEPDYYADPLLRAELFERDSWRCKYCGEQVTSGDGTLDHIVPRSKGGTNSAENLATACLMCNSIKSGRTFEEVAALLLNGVRLRREREYRDPA